MTKDEIVQEVLKRLNVSDEITADIADDAKLKEMKTEDFLNKFDAHFDTTFISKELAVKDKDIRTQIAGGVLNSAQDKVLKMAESFGFDKSIIEDGEKIESVITKAGDYFKTHIESIEANGDKDVDTRITELQDQVKTEVKKHGSIQGLLDAANGKIESMSVNHASDLQERDVNLFIKTTKEKINFKTDMTTLEQQGYQSIVDSSIKVVSEDNQFVPVDKGTGERIRSKGNKVQFATLEEVLTNIADSNNLIAKTSASKGGGGQTDKTLEDLRKNRQKPGDGNPSKRVISKAALQHEEHLSES